MHEYLQRSEAERQKLKYQARRLYQENGWLREELGNLQGLYRDSELRVVALQEKVKEYEFNAELRKFDSNEPPEQGGVGNGDAATAKTALDLGFPPDDKEDGDQDSKFYSLISCEAAKQRRFEYTELFRLTHSFVLCPR